MGSHNQTTWAPLKSITAGWFLFFWFLMKAFKGFAGKLEIINHKRIIGIKKSFGKNSGGIGRMA